MSAQAQMAQFHADSHSPRWNLSSRLVIRFCFVYFGLYCLVGQIPGILILGGLVNVVDIPDLSSFWPMRQAIFWIAAHVFHAKLPLVYSGSGSGDKTFDWVLVFCLLIFAALATGIWSALDRKRESYGTLFKWFRLFIRFTLASTLLAYGMAKVIPLQMSFPSLTRLIEPFHDFSPMGVLWYSVGASPAYEMFAGSAEMLGGILLIFPRTALLGALVCLADMTQVFLLNMTYDVPVKLFSFHLLLMALFLLAPESRRLANFFFRDRAVGPSTQPQLFRTRRANHNALTVQIIFGIWLLGTNAYSGWTGWHTRGGGRPKSPLYGIWNVNELSIDGQLRPPLLTDYDRWRRAIFEFPDSMAFQRMDDSFARYGASINSNDRTIALSKAGDKNWGANFVFRRVVRDQLVLDGRMDSRRVHMQLQLVDRDTFLLVSRGFHWVQDYPFNR